jgi:hypothetical protein
MTTLQYLKSIQIISMQLMPEEHVRIKEGTLIRRLKTIIWHLKRTRKDLLVQSRELVCKAGATYQKD